MKWYIPIIFQRHTCSTNSSPGKSIYLRLSNNIHRHNYFADPSGEIRAPNMESDHFQTI